MFPPVGNLIGLCVGATYHLPPIAEPPADAFSIGTMPGTIVKDRHCALPLPGHPAAAVGPFLEYADAMPSGHRILKRVCFFVAGVLGGGVLVLLIINPARPLEPTYVLLALAVACVVVGKLLPS